MASVLLIATRLLLEDCERSLYAIAKDTNLNEQWLRDFKHNRTPEPGINKVETLYTYLKGSPPTV